MHAGGFGPGFFDRHGHLGGDVAQDVGHGLAAQPRLAGGHEAVGQGGHDEQLHVVGDDEVAAADGGQRLARRGRAPARRAGWRRAPRPGCRAWRARARRCSSSMARRRARRRQTLPSATSSLAGDHRLQLVQRVGGAEAAQDLALLVALGVAERQAQQEAVELGLGQREGALSSIGFWVAMTRKAAAAGASRRRRSPGAPPSPPAGPTGCAAWRG